MTHRFIPGLCAFVGITSMLGFLAVATATQQPIQHQDAVKSRVRIVRLCCVVGKVTVMRPGFAKADPILANAPIQEGFELSTIADSIAVVDFENGSTAMFGGHSKLSFHQLASDAEGNKLNGMTLEQGYATFHFIPEHHSSSSVNPGGEVGNAHLPSTHGDVYQVRIADTTVTAMGTCRFRVDLNGGVFRLEVSQGKVGVATAFAASQLRAGHFLVHRSGLKVAFNIQKGIVRDDWDRWAAKQEQLVLSGMRTTHNPANSKRQFQLQELPTKP